MQVYYHNTDITRNNKTLCYVNNYGDWAYNANDFCEDAGEYAVLEIKVESGLICCEPLEQYIRRIVNRINKQGIIK